MLGFLIRRLIQTLFVLLLVTLLTFGLLKIIPGDPVFVILGSEATPQDIAELRHALGEDLPFYEQYVRWLGNAIQGDLGYSVLKYEKVTDLISQRLPVTVYISFIALVLSTFLGIVAGTICAVRRGGFLDNLVSLFSNLGLAVPTFWLGILAIYFFGLKLDLLPIQGFTWPTVDLAKSLKQLIMPVICLAIPSIAIITRQTRSTMLEVISQDYIRTARAKGLQERVIIYRHALQNALIPVITLVGIQLRILVGGSVLVETVFNIPGMGRLLVSAAFGKDFLVVQGGVLLIGVVVCLANLLVDVSYGWLDPRIRFE